MKSFRKIIFWTHLVIGLAARLVIAMSAFTGATMAFEKQTVAWCESKGRLSDFAFGKAFRAMNRSLHTGEAGGIVHQALSLLACLGALVLVWTGFAMAWRRFFGRAEKTGVQQV